MNTLKLTFILAITGFILVSGIPADIDSKAFRKDLKKALALENVQVMPIQINPNAAKKGEYYKILTHDSSELVGFVYAGRVDCCRAGGCGNLAPANEDALDNEYFDYYILFDKNRKVESVRVTNYEATYGHEITARNWLKQFIGFEGKQELRPGKEIDGISGATISVYAITADIEHKTRVLAEASQY